MSVAQTLQEYIQMLPERYQAKVLDYVEYLLFKQQQEEKDWSSLSMTFAMRGLEDEEIDFTFDDLREPFV